MLNDDLILQAKELRAANHLSEAEAVCQQILSGSPRNAEALSVLGTLCFMAGRNEEGFKYLHRAEEFQPDLFSVLYNLGLAYDRSHNNTKAEHYYKLAVNINPDHAIAWINLGGVLMRPPRRLEEAEACYYRALEIKQNDPGEQCEVGKRLLLMGRLKEAWPRYEFRYAPELNEKNTILPDLPFPQWRGESLAGKSLVLCPEQGFGDYIQFIRYAKLLKECGLNKLTVICHSSLMPLLGTMSGVDNVISTTASISAVSSHHYWSFPLSLPLYFDTTLETIPASLPYLKALPVREAFWRNALQLESFKVGLVWKGNVGHKNDANRSLPELSLLAPLWTVPGVTFVSLQKGQGEEESLQSPPERPIISLGHKISDFADTAAIVAQLDLLICVDTAAAHVAGALGKPCWVLVPAQNTDWRWLLDRTDSPWYPGVMRLFRQSSDESWSSVIEDVADSLSGLLSGGGSILTDS